MPLTHRKMCCSPLSGRKSCCSWVAAVRTGRLVPRHLWYLPRQYCDSDSVFAIIRRSTGCYWRNLLVKVQIAEEFVGGVFPPRVLWNRGHCIWWRGDRPSEARPQLPSDRHLERLIRGSAGPPLAKAVSWVTSGTSCDCCRRLGLRVCL